MTQDADYVAVALRRLRFEGVPLKASEIAHWEVITPGQARRALIRLRDEGIVFQNDNGYWQLLLNDGPGAATME